MPISRTAENNYLEVIIDPKDKTLRIVSEYSNVPLDLSGTISTRTTVNEGDLIEVNIGWPNAIDYITFQIVYQILLHKLPDSDDLITDFYDFIQDDEFFFAIEFNKDFLKTYEKLADYLMILLKELVTKLADMIGSYDEE